MFATENEKHRIIWDCEIEMHQPIMTGRPDLVLINKKKEKRKKRICHQVDFAIPVDVRVKIMEIKRLSKCSNRTHKEIETQLGRKDNQLRIMQEINKQEENNLFLAIKLKIL